MTPPRLTAHQREIRAACDELIGALEPEVLVELQRLWRDVYIHLRRLDEERAPAPLRKASYMDVYLWRAFQERLKKRIMDLVKTGAISLLTLQNAWLKGRIGRGVEIDSQQFAADFEHMLAFRITLVTQNIQRDVAKRVVNWYNTPGKKLRDLVGELRPQFGEWRARLIASTEIIRLNSGVQEHIAGALGINEWWWHSRRDQSVCEKPLTGPDGQKWNGCKALHGHTFKIGQKMPPDGSHVGCRCDGVLIVPALGKLAKDYDPNEARDESGKWTAGGGGAPKKGEATPKPKEKEHWYRRESRPWKYEPAKTFVDAVAGNKIGEFEKTQGPYGAEFISKVPGGGEIRAIYDERSKQYLARYTIDDTTLDLVADGETPKKAAWNLAAKIHREIETGSIVNYKEPDYSGINSLDEAVGELRNTKNYEGTFIFSSDGKKIFSGTGNRDSVYIPDDLPTKGAHLVHNHPTGSSLSLGDVDYAINYGLDAVSVVTPDSLYTLKIPKNAHPITTHDEKVEDKDRDIIHAFQQAVYTIEHKHKHLTAESYHPIWEEFSRLTGWKYTRTPLGKVEKAWNEADHPRGQPDNPGQFAPKEGAAQGMPGKPENRIKPKGGAPAHGGRPHRPGAPEGRDPKPVAKPVAKPQPKEVDWTDAKQGEQFSEKHGKILAGSNPMNDFGVFNLVDKKNNVWSLEIKNDKGVKAEIRAIPSKEKAGGWRVRYLEDGVPVGPPLETSNKERGALRFVEVARAEIAHDAPASKPVMIPVKPKQKEPEKREGFYGSGEEARKSMSGLYEKHQEMAAAFDQRIRELSENTIKPKMEKIEAGLLVVQNGNLDRDVDAKIRNDVNNLIDNVNQDFDQMEAMQKERIDAMAELLEPHREALRVSDPCKVQLRFAPDEWWTPYVKAGIDIFNGLVSTENIAPDSEDSNMVVFEAKGGRSGYLPNVKRIGFAPHGQMVASMIHEMAHHLEQANPKARQACKEFFDRRTTGDNIVRLRDVDEFHRFSPHEKCKPDKFFSPYCGKIYEGGETEILSMGLEEYYRDPIEFAHKDPEYFDLIFDIAHGRYA